MLRSMTLAAFATAALVASPVFAQATSEKMGVNDTFFAAVADGGMFENIIPELDAEKATNPEPKKLSKHMIEAHTKVNGQLKGLAAKEGIALPKTLSIGHQFCVDNSPAYWAKGSTRPTPTPNWSAT